MKNMFFALLLATTPALCQTTQIEGYNVYYGTLHNHSTLSDGQGSPDEAYTYARNTGKLDFFSLAEHCVMLSPEEWDSLKNVAARHNADSVFTALHGFEWSGQNGHVAIINTRQYTTCVTQPTNTFATISEWITANNGIAFFNHPGRQNGNDNEFDHFVTKPNHNIVGMELWNRSYGLERFFYNDGYYPGDGGLSYFDEANTRGWRIGAAGSEDNHSGNWGTYCEYKTAVLAKANTRKDIVEALLNRHFFSTLDKNTSLMLKANNAIMGDTVVAGKVKLRIEAGDADGESFTSITLRKNGIAFKSWATGISSPLITDSLWLSPGEYIYVIATQADGDQAISSPIFAVQVPPVYIRDTTVIYHINHDTVVVRGTGGSSCMYSSNNTFIKHDTSPRVDVTFINDTILIIDTIYVADAFPASDSNWETDTLVKIPVDTVYINTVAKRIVSIHDTIFKCIVPSGIDDNKAKSGISVSPVPFTDAIVITSAGKTPFDIALYGLAQGSMVYEAQLSTSSATLCTSNLPPGAYVLRISTHDRSFAEIIVKK